MPSLKVWEKPTRFSIADFPTIDVWRIDLRKKIEDLSWLNEDEKSRAQRYVFGSKRNQFTRSRTALRFVLAKYLDMPPQSISFSYGEHEKPDLALSSPTISFNLSHSEEIALIAVGPRGLLGIDVERKNQKRDFHGVAKRFFCQEEFQWWNDQSQDQKMDAFYKIWTLKEAYLKAWGTGLSFSSRKFCVVLKPNEEPKLLYSEMAQDDLNDWNFFSLGSVSDTYEGSLCEKGPGKKALRFFAEPLS